MSVQRKMMGEILLDIGLITQDQLDDALAQQNMTGERLGNILVDRGILSEQQLIETLEFILGIPHVQLDRMTIEPDAVKLIPANMARNHKVLPITRKNGLITLAMADPLNYGAIDDVRMVTGLDVIPVIASEKDMDTAIRQYYALRVDADVERILGELIQEEKNSLNTKKENAVLKIDDDAPVVRMVNSILAQAVQGRASDIHIEPQERDIRVRFRIDGQLYEVLNLPKKSSGAIISRIKIMAGMDIAEKRIPQDGRVRMTLEGRSVDFRISTLPAIFGEKVVLRILDRANALTAVDQLGLSTRNKEYLLSLSHRPHGMVLVTGPTGSGKTTTLYSALGEINSIDKNIITLEDPVEYSLPGINQVQVNTKTGLTFAAGLRSILRQDPDVIMVGEIRDHETAQLAVQAALTGHLVLSTLHTNSAAGAVARLTDMGIESFLLASSLTGVIAQRLVRKLCPNCRRPYRLSQEVAEKLDIGEQSGEQFYRAAGCNMCRQLGYRGRMAIQEIITVGPRLRDCINRGDTSEDAIQTTALQEGMVSIKNDGVLKALAGLTSLEEVMKAVLMGG
jgi:type IV pilus assembly protein PilB